jgi:hypothetical protein
MKNQSHYEPKPSEFTRSPAGYKVRMRKQRNCLSCNKKFNSLSVENRVCDPCKNGTYWKAGVL